MSKKSVLSTLRFVFFTIFTLALIFSAVVVTVLNQYKPVVKTYINGECIGYFSSPQQFDEVYNDLVTEKQNVDPNVKVYLESEPTFETSYIRDALLNEQNIYTNLRAQVKTEYTIYKVTVDDEEKMTFSTQDEANKYAEELKKDVAKLKTEIKTEKVSELGEITTIERAEDILKDIVDRNKPVQSTGSSNTNVGSSGNVTYLPGAINGTVNSVGAQVAYTEAGQGGIWPTIAHYISSTYGWRWGTLHTGTDIAGKYGDPIYAWKDGTVTYSGWSGSYGNIVKLDHGNGISTWYAHCSKLLVSVGQQVSQGETISLMGSTGFSTGNHVHFEVRINGVHVNSYPFIEGK